MRPIRIDTLAAALPREMARVAELIPIYASIGPPGSFAIAMMRRSLAAAAQALADGDIVAMIRAHEDLKGFKL